MKICFTLFSISILLKPTVCFIFLSFYDDKAPAEPDVARFSCNADVVQRVGANAGSTCVVGAKRKRKSMEWKCFCGWKAYFTHP